MLIVRQSDARWCERSEFLNQEKFLLLDLREAKRRLGFVRLHTYAGTWTDPSRLFDILYWTRLLPRILSWGYVLISLKCLNEIA